MVNENDPTDVERRSKALFDESTANLSGDVRSRLARARRSALEDAKSRRKYRVWLPAVGLATAAAVTGVVVVPGLKQQRTSPASIASADDMTLLLNSENLELLEDMEFYAWFDSDDETPTGGDSNART